MGAGLPGDLGAKIRHAHPPAIDELAVQENFGMAEGMLTFVRLDDSYQIRLETVGRPLCADDEVILVDDEGKEVPDGEVGELACRGPYTLRRYYHAAEHNTAEGFYLSGDLSRGRGARPVQASRRLELIEELPLSPSARSREPR